jgi:hypothetical protein
MIPLSKITLTNSFRENSTNLRNPEYEILAKQSYLPDSSRLKLDLILTDDIYRKIADLLSDSRVINKIFLLREENTFCIWTSLRESGKDSRHALYAQELKIIEFFSRTEFHFDFHLAEADDTEELLASGAKIIYPGAKI